MANAAPATIFSDLLGQAVEALRKRPTAFELRRLDRDAQALSKANAAQAFEIRAHVAAAEDRYDDADALYQRALGLSDQIQATVVRYLIALGATAQADKVKAVFLKYKDLLRTDPTALRAAKRVLGGNGWWETSMALDQDLQRMGLDSDQREDAFCTVDTGKVPESEVAEAVSFVRRFLRTRDAAISEVHSMAVPFETGASAIFYEFFLLANEVETADLEWDLFAELSERRFPIEENKSFVVALAPVGSNANHKH